MQPIKTAAFVRGANRAKAVKAVKAVKGASTIEFMIVAPLFLLLILLTLEMGLIYRAKFTLNHAAQQVARAGSFNNGCMGAMDAQLVRSLSPLYLRSNPTLTHFLALRTLKSEVIKLYTDIDITMPSAQTFADNQVNAALQPSQISSCAQTTYGTKPYRRTAFIPVNTDRPPTSDSSTTASSLFATTLKVELRYCYRLVFPLVGWLLDSLQRSTRLDLASQGLYRQCINGAGFDAFGDKTMQFVILNAHALAWMQTPFLKNSLKEQ